MLLCPQRLTPETHSGLMHYSRAQRVNKKRCCFEHPGAVSLQSLLWVKEGGEKKPQTLISHKTTIWLRLLSQQQSRSTGVPLLMCAGPSEEPHLQRTHAGFAPVFTAAHVREPMWVCVTSIRQRGCFHHVSSKEGSVQSVSARGERECR